MKRNIICHGLIAASLFFTACASTPNEVKSAQDHPTDLDQINAIPACAVTSGDLTFTHTLNGADTCVSVLPNGALEFYCREGLDFFCDPNGGKLSNTTLPILLVPVDNAKPFTLIAKVTPEFTPEGLYNAADLFVYANDTLWQKLAFEQDEYGAHRIVSVRTAGTSDDSNHDKIDDTSVYLKISSDASTIASYYSLDKKKLHMVRLYKNDYPADIYLGVSSQSPQKGGCTSLFEELELSYDNVQDFRMGE